MPRSGGKRRKTRTHDVSKQIVSNYDEIPKSFVIKKGKVVKSVSLLTRQVRQMMLPWTAKNLKERKGNTIRDFISVASPLGVTHLFAVSQRNNHVILRLSKLPTGPSLTFHVSEYSLMADVRSTQTKSRNTMSDFLKSPLTVLHGFKPSSSSNSASTSLSSSIDSRAVELMKSMFASLFPSIDVKDLNMESASKRVVLFEHEGDGVVLVRQYAIVRTLTGISDSVAHLYESSLAGSTALLPPTNKVEVKVKEEIDLDNTHAGSSSSSKGDTSSSNIASNKLKDDDDDDRNVIILTTDLLEKKIQDKKMKGEKLADQIKLEAPQAHQVGLKISLIELGPRISLKLVRVQTGVFDGEKLWEAPVYHALDNFDTQQ